MRKLTINKVTCTHKTNGPGQDDVFFMTQVDGGPPLRYPIDGTFEMDNGDEVQFPVDGKPAPQYFFTNELYISVWDHDGPINLLNEADMLGNVGLTPSSQSGTFSIWGVDSSRYDLDVTIEDQQPPAVDDGEDIPEDLKQLAASAVIAWSQTDDGKDAIEESDPDDLLDILSGALESDSFRDVINKALDYVPIKAISLGLMGQVEIFIGIDGAFGYAMDLKNWPSSSAIFAGGGVVGGVDAGIQGTIAMGFWFEETADIGGFYTGAEVDVDDIVGVTAAAWASTSDKDSFKDESGVNLEYAKVIFLGIDVGIDDGVEAEEAYFFAGHLSDYPVFQSGPYKNMAMMTELTCEHKDALTGHDDVHMLYTIDGHSTEYRYPIWNDFEMDSDDDDEWQCGNVVKFDESIEVSLYTQGDELETKTYEIGDFNGVGSTVECKFNDGDDIEYHLTIELIATS